MQGRGEMAMDNSPYVLESEKWTIHLLQNRTILFALDMNILTSLNAPAMSVIYQNYRAFC